MKGNNGGWRGDGREARGLIGCGCGKHAVTIQQLTCATYSQSHRIKCLRELVSKPSQAIQFHNITKETGIGIVSQKKGQGSLGKNIRTNVPPLIPPLAHGSSPPPPPPLTPPCPSSFRQICSKIVCCPPPATNLFVVQN